MYALPQKSKNEIDDTGYDSNGNKTNSTKVQKIWKQKLNQII